jgi:hypothetical protein
MSASTAASSPWIRKPVSGPIPWQARFRWFAIGRKGFRRRPDNLAKSARIKGLPIRIATGPGSERGRLCLSDFLAITNPDLCPAQEPEIHINSPENSLAISRQLPRKLGTLPTGKVKLFANETRGYRHKVRKHTGSTNVQHDPGCCVLEVEPLQAARRCTAPPHFPQGAIYRPSGPTPR